MSLDPDISPEENRGSEKVKGFEKGTQLGSSRAGSYFVTVRAVYHFYKPVPFFFLKWPCTRAVDPLWAKDFKFQMCDLQGCASSTSFTSNHCIYFSNFPLGIR